MACRARGGCCSLSERARSATEKRTAKQIIGLSQTECQPFRLYSFLSFLLYLYSFRRVIGVDRSGLGVPRSGGEVLEWAKADPSTERRTPIPNRSCCTVWSPATV